MASPNLPGPPHAPPPAPSKIKVKTTSPIVPPNADRAPIRTERLLIRPFDASDAEAVYQFRKQPEVMVWTMLGVVDKDVNESRAFVERFLPPKDLNTFNYVVEYLGDVSKSDDANGVVIGAAGCHKMDSISGWPEVGYMFRKEYWGKGLATEFLRAFTKAWWALPRREIELEIDDASVEKLRRGKGEVNDGDVIRVPEALMAMIEASNGGSRKVLEKTGFKEYKSWTEPDSRAHYTNRQATLVAFLLGAPDS
ncbi:hypothetical protein ANO14919_106030 [Xylariales sp. No.14919]|nr:hypothetical protein ANO14919_106030 [Xylariales sp. No.14919]